MNSMTAETQEMPPIFLNIWTTVRILASSFILAKATSMYLSPGFSGQLSEISLITALTVAGLVVLFGKLPKAIGKRTAPAKISERIEPSVVADPIVQNVFAPIPLGSEGNGDPDGCDVTNIFAEPRKPITVNAVVAG